MGQDTVAPVQFNKLFPEWAHVTFDERVAGQYDSITDTIMNGYNYGGRGQIILTDEEYVYICSPYSGTRPFLGLLVEKIAMQNGKTQATYSYRYPQSETQFQVENVMGMELTEGGDYLELYIWHDDTIGDKDYHKGSFRVIVLNSEDLSMDHITAGRDAPPGFPIYEGEGGNANILVLQNRKIIQKLDTNRYVLFQCARDAPLLDTGHYGLQKVIVDEWGHLIEKKERLLEEKGGVSFYHYFNPILIGGGDTIMHPVFYGQFDSSQRNFSINYYDKDLNLLKELDLTDKLKKDILPGGIGYIDKDVIVFNGFFASDFEGVSPSYAYAFTPYGEYITGAKLGSSPYPIHYILGTKESISVLQVLPYGIDRSSTWSMFKFGKDEKIQTIYKNQKFLPEDKFIGPYRFERLPNGDYLLLGYYVSKCVTCRRYLKYYAKVTFYFKKETLLSTGINDLLVPSTYTLLPNPAHEKVSIHFETPFVGRINIYDVMGKNLKSVQVDHSRSVTFDVSVMPRGTYLVVPVRSSSTEKVFEGKILQVE